MKIEPIVGDIVLGLITSHPYKVVDDATFDGDFHDEMPLSLVVGKGMVITHRNNEPLMNANKPTA